MDEVLDAFVRRRAGHACEYCRMPQAYYRTRHQIDHVIARQHHGPTVAENLALACFSCNNHKGPNLAGIDPSTGRLTPLFHPRRNRWSSHFRWQGSILVGKSSRGRATIDVLAINHPDCVAVREALIIEGVFPPRRRPRTED